VRLWWTILFAAVNLAALGLFVVAPFVGWWLPRGESTHAWDVDFLFYVILWITGFFFILTEALLIIFLYRYASRDDGKRRVYTSTGPNVFQRVFKPVSDLIHDQHRLELTWTIIPGIILLLIAFVQVEAWAQIKYTSRQPKFTDEKEPLPIEVTARQFEWRMRYPSPNRLKEIKKDPEQAKRFARDDHFDDVHVVNEIHTWKGQTVLVYLRSTDVIHSFNIPHMRVKQDSLPGKVIPVWFTPLRSNTKYNEQKKRWEDGGGLDGKGEPIDRHLVWEIPCAELCGWGHYHMIGRVYVHETRQDFDRWLRAAQESQDASSVSQAAVRK
jgi:cytochrome c oxidase subunit 2